MTISVNMRYLSMFFVLLWLLGPVCSTDEGTEPKEQWKLPRGRKLTHPTNLNPNTLPEESEETHDNEASKNNVDDVPRDLKTDLQNIHIDMIRSIKPFPLKNGTTTPTPSSSPTFGEEYIFNTANPQIIKNHEHNLYSEKTVLDAYYHGLNRLTSKVYSKECYKVSVLLDHFLLYNNHSCHHDFHANMPICFIFYAIICTHIITTHLLLTLSLHTMKLILYRL
jgi:hypothetical protein